MHKQLFKDLQLCIFTRSSQNALQSDLLNEEGSSEHIVLKKSSKN